MIQISLLVRKDGAMATRAAKHAKRPLEYELGSGEDLRVQGTLSAREAEIFYRVYEELDLSQSGVLGLFIRNSETGEDGLPLWLHNILKPRVDEQLPLSAA